MHLAPHCLALNEWQHISRNHAIAPLHPTLAPVQVAAAVPLTTQPSLKQSHDDAGLALTIALAMWKIVSLGTLGPDNPGPQQGSGREDRQDLTAEALQRAQRCNAELLYTGALCCMFPACMLPSRSLTSIALCLHGRGCT